MASGPGKGTPDAKQPEHRPASGSTNEPREATGDTPGGTPHGAPDPRSSVRKKGVDQPNLTPDQPAAEWQRAEHTSPATDAQADNLISSAGSEGLAKQAVDTAGQRNPQRRGGTGKQNESAAAPSPSADPQPGGPPSPASGIDPRRQSQTSAAPTNASATQAAGSEEGGADFPAGKANSKDQLAGQLGFASFLECFETSQPLNQEQGNVWYLTATGGNHWYLWNSQTLEYSRPLPTLERAKQASNFTR